MSRLTVGQKADRALRFLLSLKNPRITAPLVHHGFSAADLDEGWRLLRSLAAVRLDRVPPRQGVPAAVAELDEWENVWFPIAKLTLERHHPEAASLVFRNLTQTTGPQVVIGVGMFIERLRRLADEDQLGAEGQAARDRLASRGLTDAVLDATEAVVASLNQFSAPSETSLEDDAGAVQAAEDALWTWYLEWSGIARTRITDRRLLRSMGFLRYRGRGQRLDVIETEPGSEDDAPGADALPGPEPVVGLLSDGAPNEATT